MRTDFFTILPLTDCLRDANPPGGSQFSMDARSDRSTLALMLELAGLEYAEFDPDFMR